MTERPWRLRMQRPIQPAGAAHCALVSDRPGRRRLCLGGPDFGGTTHARQLGVRAPRLGRPVLPRGPAGRSRWYADLLKQSVDPEVAAAYLEFTHDLDIKAILSRIAAPALVLIRSGNRYVPPSAVSATAALIPNARLFSVDGDIGHPPLGDISYVETIATFLDEGRSPEPMDPFPAAPPSSSSPTSSTPPPSPNASATPLSATRRASWTPRFAPSPATTAAAPSTASSWATA